MSRYRPARGRLEPSSHLTQVGDGHNLTLPLLLLLLLLLLLAPVVAVAVLVQLSLPPSL